jgi:hypothetical protein
MRISLGGALLEKGNGCDVQEGMPQLGVRIYTPKRPGTSADITKHCSSFETKEKETHVSECLPVLQVESTP